VSYSQNNQVVWEGGQRVPCLMTWKGVIPEGVVCNNISSALDILPTITEITGVNLPKRKIDGVSLWKLLNGDFSNQPRDTFLYYYRANNQ
jgi:arylsulfatase A-like enzyme